MKDEKLFEPGLWGLHYYRASMPPKKRALDKAVDVGITNSNLHCNAKTWDCLFLRESMTARSAGGQFARFFIDRNTKDG